MSTKYDTALNRYQKIETKIVDQTLEVQAIRDRLEAIKLGMFKGSLKTSKKELLTFCSHFEVQTADLSASIEQIKNEIEDDLIKAGNAFPARQ